MQGRPGRGALRSGGLRFVVGRVFMRALRSIVTSSRSLSSPDGRSELAGLYVRVAEGA
jgi:hypothetical protein